MPQKVFSTNINITFIDICLEYLLNLIRIFVYNDLNNNFKYTLETKAVKML